MSELAIPSSRGYRSEGAIAKRTCWLLEARDAQLPPRRELCSRIVWWRAGRGFGKSRTCLEALVDFCRRYSGLRVVVVSPTSGDLTATVFEGESGFVNIIAEDELLHGSWDADYNKTSHVIRFANGSAIFGFSAERPNRMRGPQFHIGCAEEISSWSENTGGAKAAKLALDMLEFCVRLPFTQKMIDEGGDPGPLRLLVSSTPKKNAISRGLANDPDVTVISGSSYENIDNLDPAYIERVINKYEGTALGRQELHGELLSDDPEGNVVKSGWIRWYRGDIARITFNAVRVGHDPAVTSDKKSSDEHGIIASGRIAAYEMDDDPDPLVVEHPRAGDIIILEDRSDVLTPVQAMRRAIALAEKWESPRIILEQNQGFDTWKVVFTQAEGDESEIRLQPETATKSKELRLAPLATIMEKGSPEPMPDAPPYDGPRVWFLAGAGLEMLVEELTSWVPAESSDSPNRVDAAVWSCFGLGVRGTKETGTRRAGRASEVL